MTIERKNEAWIGMDVILFGSLTKKTLFSVFNINYGYINPDVVPVNSVT